MEQDVALTGAGNQRAQQILPNVYGDGSILNYLNINAFLPLLRRPKAYTQPPDRLRFQAPT
jgi:hypothetical protein